MEPEGKENSKSTEDPEKQKIFHGQNRADNLGEIKSRNKSKNKEASHCLEMQ